MYIKNIFGFYVIIKCVGKEVFDNIVFEGVMLVVFFSKLKFFFQVFVDYIKRKNVKKFSGFKLGMVIYEINSIIYVIFEEEIVVKFKVKFE